MQPNQQQPPADQWQQPTPSPSAAPYQAPAEPVPVPSQPMPEVPPAVPVVPAVPVASTAPATDPSPVVLPEEPVQPEETQPDTSEQAADPTIIQSDPSEDDTALLRWEGTEYIHSPRSVKWYIFFGIAAVLAAVLAVVVLKSITFAILVPVMALALVMYVRRPPEVIQYTLSRKGLHVNDKLYTYDVFKAFGVVSHAGHHSVALIPRKRFQISQTIYFPEEIGEQVVDMLASRLPMKEITPDAIDRLLAKLHL